MIYQARQLSHCPFVWAMAKGARTVGLAPFLYGLAVYLSAS